MQVGIDEIDQTLANYLHTLDARITFCLIFPSMFSGENCEIKAPLWAARYVDRHHTAQGKWTKDLYSRPTRHRREKRTIKEPTYGVREKPIASGQGPLSNTISQRSAEI